VEARLDLPEKARDDVGGRGDGGADHGAVVHDDEARVCR
jgi:hypothetical protein